MWLERACVGLLGPWAVGSRALIGSEQPTNSHLACRESSSWRPLATLCPSEWSVGCIVLLVGWVRLAGCGSFSKSARQSSFTFESPSHPLTPAALFSSTPIAGSFCAMDQALRCEVGGWMGWEQDGGFFFTFDRWLAHCSSYPRPPQPAQLAFQHQHHIHSIVQCSGRASLGA